MPPVTSFLPYFILFSKYCWMKPVNSSRLTYVFIIFYLATYGYGYPYFIIFHTLLHMFDFKIFDLSLVC